MIQINVSLKVLVTLTSQEFTVSHWQFMLICLLLSQSGQNVARQQVSKVRGQKCVVMWIMAEAIHRHELTKLN